jgi:hypothetical protein
VRELRGPDLTTAKRDELIKVSEDWLRGKAVKDRRLKLLVRHVDFSSLAAGCALGPRLFVAEAGAGGRVQGFLLLDPLCKGEQPDNGLQGLQAKH